jgi:ADP-ribosylglycohydrolase
MIEPHRVRGSLLGLAVGDAIGGTLEFKPPGTFAPIDDMRGGGPHDLRPGEWTDDTSMALCLAESLVERGGMDPVDQLERYVRWFRHGYLSSKDRCFDIGNTTREALQRFERDPQPFPGPSDEWSAGNGSIMRLAPVPLFFAGDIDGAVERSGESSRTTHGEPRCIDACRLLGAMIAAAAAGAGKDEVLSETFWRWGPCTRRSRQSPVAPGGRRSLRRSAGRVRRRIARGRPCGRSAARTTSARACCSRSTSATTPTRRGLSTASWRARCTAKTRSPPSGALGWRSGS